MSPRPETPDPLREMLRRGDPLGDGEALDAAEAGRIRRASLAHLAERGRGRRRAGPALAAALASLALLVALGVPLWRQRAGAPVEPAAADGPAAAAEAEPGRIVADRGPEPAPARPSARELAESPSEPASAELPAIGPRADPPRIAEEASPAAEGNRLAASGGTTAGPAERQRRRIEFAAPGGTRVVWVLDTEFRL